MNIKKILSSRKVRYGSVATVLTAAFLAAVVLINVIATVLVERFPLKVDLTEGGIFQLTDDSINFLRELDKDVEITVLADEKTWTSSGTYFVQAVEVINQYAQYSSHVTVSYVDIVKNPTFVSRYPALNLVSNQILVTSGDRSRVVNYTDLFNVENYYVTSSKAEQVMTAALMYATSDDLTKVSLLTGFEEQDSSGIVSLLEKNNYLVTSQNLVTEDIDPEADMAILVAPARDLDADILKKLDTFLNNGGKYGKHLLYFADTAQGELPNLDAFLREWGIGVESGVVFQTDATKIFNYSPYFSLVDYADEVFAEKFTSRNIYPIMPYARPLTQLFTERNGFSTQVILQFGEKAGVLPADAGQDYQVTEDDIRGPIPAAIISSKIEYEGLDRKVSNVVVVGSTLSIDNSLLESTAVNNGEYYINMVNQLTERGDTISIAPKSFGGEALNINQQQTNTLMIVFVVLVPVATLAAGLVVWLRRRHK